MVTLNDNINNFVKIYEFVSISEIIGFFVSFLFYLITQKSDLQPRPQVNNNQYLYRYLNKWKGFFFKFFYYLILKFPKLCKFRQESIYI